MSGVYDDDRTVSIATGTDSAPVNNITRFTFIYYV